jgi:hypothetical protein
MRQGLVQDSGADTGTAYREKKAGLERQNFHVMRPSAKASISKDHVG